MNKIFPIIVLILLAVALSGCTGSESVKTTPVVPTPTPTPTPTPAIVTPAPTPELTPFVAATPTEKNVTIIVVLWVNKMDSDYTLVEMDKKIPDMVLRVRNSYIFNTTGNYRIGLYFKPMHGEPAILTINVR
jgi:PBP1b-binding outer membrane lipoprotein LpoB